MFQRRPHQDDTPRPHHPIHACSGRSVNQLSGPACRAASDLISNVTSEWIAAAFGVVGAVVGAGATLTANWIATRTQLELAAHNREQQRAEVRRAACAEYLVAVDSFMDQARELVSRMENDAPRPQCDAAHASYFAGWEHLQRVRAPVVIAGPSELGDRTDALRHQLAALGDECDSWYTAHKNGSTRGRAAKFSTAQHAAHDARTAFVSVAQKNAYPGPSESAG